MSRVFLITGASAGFGLDMSLAALEAGHRVIGAVRNAGKSAEAVSKLKAAGASIIEVDMASDAATIHAAAKKAEAVYGHVDVLVNNAGYSLLGALEDFGSEESHQQFDTNFFGPVFMIQGLLPGMRARKSGTIVNISSSAGVDGLPTCGMYAATKFALEGMSEALAREVAEFGIRVLIVQPGAFRTRFLTSKMPAGKGLSPAYKGTAVEKTMNLFDTANGKQPGDPLKAVAAIIQAAASDGTKCSVNGVEVNRLPLGSDCVMRHETKLQGLKHDLEACRAVADACWYPGATKTH